MVNDNRIPLCNFIIQSLLLAIVKYVNKMYPSTDSMTLCSSQKQSSDLGGACLAVLLYSHQTVVEVILKMNEEMAQSQHESQSV